MREAARQRAIASLRRYAPHAGDVAVDELGHGLDHSAFIAGDLVLRVAQVRSVGGEARLLQVVASRVSIPVPAPRFVDEEAGVLAYPRIPGGSLLGRTPHPRVAVVLGRFLRELHDTDPDGLLTGVIDWSDAAISDPALDFARLYRDFGLAFLTAVLESYGGIDDPEAAMARIEFFARCAALEDLSYGRACARSEYAHAAERALTRLFHRSS